VALLARPVVEKRQHERLLHLVRPLVGEEDPGDMGLAKLDPLWCMWIELGLEHRRDKLHG
jgi:hypothetical protein